MNSCMLTVEATNFELNIEVKLNEVRLYVPVKKALPQEELLAKSGKMSSNINNKPRTEPKEAAQPAPRPESVKRADYESQNQNPTILRVIEPIANKWFSLRDLIRVRYHN